MRGIVPVSTPVAVRDEPEGAIVEAEVELDAGVLGAVMVFALAADAEACRSL